MRKIIYSRPDGGVSIVHPVINTAGDEGMTEAQAEARAWQKLPKDAGNPQWITEAEIPKDRAYRNAWTHGGNAIALDAVKVAAIDVALQALKAG